MLYLFFSNDGYNNLGYESLDKIFKLFKPLVVH